MGFDEFLGNQRILSALRGMLRRERVPSALLFTGPRGIGKYTLARMFAQAANCERLKDDFCGECDTCRRISRLADPAPLVELGLAERGESADAAMVERTPLLIETHPDVWLIVPDPVRLRTPVARPMIRVGQLRGAARGLFQVTRPQACFHHGWRGYDALDGRRLVSENSGRAAGMRHLDSSGANAGLFVAHDSIALPAVPFRARDRKSVV